MSEAPATDNSINATRRHLGIQAAYELEAQLEVLRQLAAKDADGGEGLDAEFVRGLAVRAKELVGVAMAVIDNDVDEAGAWLTVYGERMPGK